VDEARVDAILDQLVAWGLVEQAEGDLRATRRWSAKLQAAAEKLNIIHAQTGVQVAGNPLVVATSQALANENLDIVPQSFDDFVRVLVMLELSRMTPAKRAQLGFADVLFPGETPASSAHSVDF
jgi:hypothetical protein